MFCESARRNVSIDNERGRLSIMCGFVAPGNERNLLLRAYEPFCGEMGEGCWVGSWCCNCENELLLLPIKLLLH